MAIVRNMGITFLASAGLLIACTVPTQTSRAENNDMAAIFSAYERPDHPGVSILVSEKGDTVFRQHFGAANISDGIPISDATVFNIGSVSKQFTVFAILLLQDQGALSLDDDVRMYFPELSGIEEPITLEDLARHTSGLRSANFLALMAGWRQPDMRTQEQMLDLTFRQTSLEFKPGTEYKYSNTGTLLLAEVVERVSGQPFADFMQEKVFSPLGMEQTFVRDDITSIIPHEAYGYFEEDGVVKIALNPISHFGFSNVYSTVDDLSLWANNFSTRKLGSDTLFNSMLSPTTLADGRRVDHTMGLFKTPYRGLTQFQHTGSHRAYLSYFGFYPDQEVSIIMLSNDGRFDLFGNANAIADQVFSDLPKPEAPTGFDPNFLTDFNYATLRASEGGYWSGKAKLLRHLRVEDDHLLYVRPGGAESVFKAIGPNRFAMEGSEDEIIITLYEDSFSFDIDGDVDSFRRIEAVAKSDPNDFVGVYYSRELGQSIEVFACEGSLRVSLPKRETFSIAELFPDTFQTDQWFLSHMEFRRNGLDQVTGFQASNVNVIDVIFDRVMSPDLQEPFSDVYVFGCAATE